MCAMDSIIIWTIYKPLYTTIGLDDHHLHNRETILGSFFKDPASQPCHITLPETNIAHENPHLSW